MMGPCIQLVVQILVGMYSHLYYVGYLEILTKLSEMSLWTYTWILVYYFSHVVIDCVFFFAFSDTWWSYEHVKSSFWYMDSFCSDDHGGVVYKQKSIFCLFIFLSTWWLFGWIARSDILGFLIYILMCLVMIITLTYGMDETLWCMVNRYAWL